MILRYPGAKLNAARDILSLAPDDFSEFRDCFTGSAALLWEVPTERKRWINDIDPDVIRFHRALKSQPGFADQIIELRNRFVDADTDAIQRQFNLSKVEWFNHDCPLSYWYLRCLAFGQFVKRSRHNLCSFGCQHYRNTLRSCVPEQVKRAHEIMQGVKITCGDYSRLLEAPGKDVWIFVDPSYQIVNRDSLYETELTPEEHCELEERLRSCRHPWLLTIGINGLTHKLYVRSRHYNVYHREYAYCGVNRKKQVRKWELIVTNY